VEGFHSNPISMVADYFENMGIRIGCYFLRHDPILKSSTENGAAQQYLYWRNMSIIAPNKWRNIVLCANRSGAIYVYV